MMFLSIDNLLNNHGPSNDINQYITNLPEPLSPLSPPTPVNSQPFNFIPKNVTPIMKDDSIQHKNKFTDEEDIKLKYFVHMYGSNNWELIASALGTKNERQCRERWRNYLNPKLTTNPWTVEEDMQLVQKYAQYGSKWKRIANEMTGRSVNSVRNRWKLLLKNTEKHSNAQVF